jgi:hypothetical protein
VSRGQKNASTDTVLADADIDWCAQLIADVEHPEVSWTTRAVDGEGVRVRYVPTKFTDANQKLWPPPGIIDGDGAGMGDIDDFQLLPANSGDPDVDVAVTTQLKALGVIGAGRDATPEQATNYKRLLDAVSSEHRSTNMDEFRRIGIEVTFDSMTLFGTSQTTVRWRARNRSAPIRHLGSTTDVRPITDQSAGHQFLRTAQTGWAVGGNINGEIGVPLGDDAPIATMQFSFAPISGSYDRTFIDTDGVSVRRNVLTEGEKGAVHGFRVPLAVTAEIIDIDDEPIWTYPGEGQPADVRYWVPRYLVSSTEPAPRPPIEVRPVSAEDQASLRRPGAQRFRLPAVTTVVRGSVEFDRVFTYLLRKVFGGPAVDPGTAVAPEAARPSAERLRVLASVLLSLISTILALIHTFPGIAWLVRMLIALVRALVGTRPSLEGTKSARIRRAFVNSTNLRSNVLLALDSAYVSDQIFESGMVSTFEGHLELTAYEGRPTYVPPGIGDEEPEFYFEEFVVVTVGRRTARTDSRSYTPEGGAALNHRPKNGWVVSLSGSGRHVRGKATTTTTQRQYLDVRLYGYEEKLYTLRIPMTFIAAVQGGSRNLLSFLTSIVGYHWIRSAERAIDVPDAVEVHATTRELLAIWRAMGQRGGTGERIIGLPPTLAAMLAQLETMADADGRLSVDEIVAQPGPNPTNGAIRFLPRRIVEHLGLGDAAVADVRETGPARGLYDSALTAVWRTIGGTDQPTSTTYVPGLREWVAALSAPGVLRAAVGKLFSSGTADPAAMVPLHQSVFLTTQYGGAVRVRVTLVGRIQADLRRMFGRTSSAYGVESHELAGTGTTHHSERRREWGGGPGVQMLIPGEQTLSAHGSRYQATGNRLRRHATSHGGTSDHHYASKSSGSVVFEPIPVQLAFVAQADPLPGGLHTSLVPWVTYHVRRLIERALPEMPCFLPKCPAGPEPRSVDAAATLVIHEGDTTFRPLLAAPPPWLVPARSFNTDPRTIAALPGTADHHPVVGQMQPWPLHGGMPVEYKISWFNGNATLADAAKEVLPEVAASSTGSTDIDDVFDGLAASVFLRDLLDVRPDDSPAAPSSSEHFRAAGTGGVPVAGTLTITWEAATPWRESTDTMENDPTPFPVGDTASATVEHLAMRTSHSTAAATVSQTLSLLGTPNLSWRTAQSDPALGSAPGNRRMPSVAAVQLTATGGEALSVSTFDYSTNRRGLRMLARPRGAGFGQSSNRLVHRYLLFRVTGESRHANLPARRREVWIVALIEIRAHQALLPQLTSPPTNEIGDLVSAPRLVPSIEPGRDTSPTVGAAPATGHDLAASTEPSPVRTSPPAELEASTDPLAATPPVVATEDPTNTQPEALTNPSTRATPQPGLEVAPGRPINTEPEPPAKGSLVTSPDPEPGLLTAAPPEFLTGRPAHTPPEPGTSPPPADRSRRPIERPSDAESPSMRARQWLPLAVAPRVSRPLSKAAFVDLMNQVVRDTPPEALGAEPCLVLAERARVELYDRRSASRKHVDDLGVGPRPGRIALGAGGGWPLPSWKAVADRLADAEHGSSALALISRQGRVGHVLLVYLSSDEGLVPFGFGRVGDVVTGQTVDLPNESPTSTRVMLFDPSGRAITDPFIGFRDSSSTVRAMIDKPLDNRFAGGGLESGPTIPTRPTGGPIIPAAAAAEIAAAGQLNGSPVASSRGPGIERTTTVGKPPGGAVGPERHLTPSGAARWDGNGRNGSGERSSTGTHQIQWQPAHSVLPVRHHHLTVTNAGHRRRALQDALVYDPPSGSASLAQVVNASRAYRSASGNAARRSSLIAALPRSAPATIDALARIARNHATTIEDIADAEVYRLLSHALSGRYVPGHKPARIRNLGAVASYEWTTALLSLRSERPQHAAALTNLIVKTLAPCT